MGRIVLPEMKKYRYEDTLPPEQLCSVGTLGILIPPSTILTCIWFLTEQSIGKLFFKALVFSRADPALIFSVTIYLAINPQLGLGR